MLLRDRLEQLQIERIAHIVHDSLDCYTLPTEVSRKINFIFYLVEDIRLGRDDAKRRLETACLNSTAALTRTYFQSCPESKPRCSRNVLVGWHLVD